MDATQWQFLLAPGVLPASEEAVESFGSPGRDLFYEENATMILEGWPVLKDEPEGFNLATLEAPQPITTKVALFDPSDIRPDEPIPF